MKNTPLSDTRKQEIINVIEEMARRSGGRPCMIVIRLVDGIPQIYEAMQPVRVGRENEAGFLVAKNGT